jgi:predicted sulfurtransferase
MGMQGKPFPWKENIMQRLQARIFAAFSVCCLCAGVVEAADYTKDSLDTVKKKLADNEAVLVDVREPSEWKAGHIESAVFLPLRSLQKNQNESRKLPKSKVIYTYCKSGVRS